MNVGLTASDPPGATHDLTMSKSGRDSLCGDRRTDVTGLSRREMGTIVHLKMNKNTEHLANI